MLLKMLDPRLMHTKESDWKTAGFVMGRSAAWRNWARGGIGIRNGWGRGKNEGQDGVG